MNDKTPAISTKHKSRFFPDRSKTSQRPSNRCIEPSVHISAAEGNTTGCAQQCANTGAVLEDVLVNTRSENKGYRSSPSSENMLEPVTAMYTRTLGEVHFQSSAGLSLQQQDHEDVKRSDCSFQKLERTDATSMPKYNATKVDDQRRKATDSMSPFFRQIQRETVSCLRFPARNARIFGLIQERLSDDPFGLLVAVIFLHQTKGAVAIPLLLAFIQVFNTPETLAKASADSIAPFIRHLGLHNRRSELLIALAEAWLKQPPRKGRRYRYLHYPHHGSGADIRKSEEPLEDEDLRDAWEIAHLPGIGPYALDSWRIFCRDALRERRIICDQRDIAGNEESILLSDEEWTRVLPRDKELRAYLQWRWIKFGWLWDPFSGNRLKVGIDTLRSMEKSEISHYGGIVNPWMSSKGMIVPEEQILGGYC